jgi:hypothetical protein
MNLDKPLYQGFGVILAQAEAGELSAKNEE